MQDVPPFELASEAYLSALLDALPAFVVRLGNELAREGEGDVPWLDDLERRLADELRALLSGPAEAQREPPIGLVRRVVLEAIQLHIPRPRFDQLERRGLLPRSAVDIAPDLAALQLQWGLAKAQAMRSSASATRE